jgi:hypothetical protein
MAPENVTQVESQPDGGYRQQLVMFDDLVLASGYRAQDNRANALFKKVRDLVGDGLACRPAVHVETMRKNQPSRTQGSAFRKLGFLNRLLIGSRMPKPPLALL